MSLGGALILAGVLSIFGGPPRSVQVTDLEVDLGESRLQVSFGLDGGFDEELLERIEAGLPTGFTYQFKLVRPLRGWFDRSLASSQLEVVGMYNAVTHEYSVNYKHNGKLTISRVVNDREELETALTRFEDFAPFPIEELTPRKQVRLRVRAALGSRNLLLLIPTTVHTGWAESERFLLSEPGVIVQE